MTNDGALASRRHRHSPFAIPPALATFPAGPILLHLSRLRRVKALILFLCLAAAARAQSPPADDIARFLAGLPLEGTTLRNFAMVPAWRQHAKQLDEAWSQ